MYFLLIYIYVNELIYIVLYCVLLYTQSASQSCGGGVSMCFCVFYSYLIFITCIVVVSVYRKLVTLKYIVQTYLSIKLFLASDL